MKRNYYFIICALMVFGVAMSGCSKKDGSAQEEKHEHEHEEADVEWKEMDDFHSLMAEAFHPYKDSMNLAPAKMYADSMKISAEKWASAPLPEKVDNDDVKSKLQALKDGTTAFAESAKTGDDKTVGEALTKLHDLFHELQGLWYGGKGHDHQHEH
jgi:hypothetical protein